jgi:hypothetical protein
MIDTLKLKANNDNERPFLESVMKPRSKESRYYISQLKTGRDNSGSPKANAHLDHFTQLLKVMANPAEAVFWSAEEMTRKRNHLMNYKGPIRFQGPFIRVKELLRKNYIADKSLKEIRVPLRQHEEPKYFLVLDLVRILVHTTQLSSNEDDFSFAATNKDGPKKKFNVVYRPFLCEFLERMQQYYYLVIYTAAHRSYAEKILDMLDPQRSIFKAVLCSEYCMKPDYSRAVN